MGKQAGVVTIRLKAGSAELFTDINAAKAKVREFGAETEKANVQATTSTKSTVAAFKVLEGGFPVRSAAAFANQMLGLGPIMEKAFPIIGAVVFADVLYKVGSEVYNFFQKISQAPEKIRGAFRSLDDSLRTTNDELRVSNDRLENDIAKLEGRRQNTLKLALDEARVAADKLAASLEKDLDAMAKLMKDNEVSAFASFFTGQGETKELRKQFSGETGHGGFVGRVEGINASGYSGISTATTEKQKNEARAAWNTALLAEYRAELALVNGELSKASTAQKDIRDAVTKFGGKAGATFMDAKVEELTALRRGLEAMVAHVPLASVNEDLKDKMQGLQAGALEASIRAPFEKAIADLKAQAESLGDKIGAVGKNSGFQIMAEAAGSAFKKITDLNEQLKKHHRELTDGQRVEIAVGENIVAAANAELRWKSAMEANQTSVNDRIASLKLLTEAIGEGYEAAKKANVETSVMGVMKDKFNDPAKSGDKERLRNQFGGAFDAEQSLQSGKAIDAMEKQVELENTLAQAQAKGAQAVREANLQFKLNEIAKNNSAEAAGKLMQAEIDLYNAQNMNIGEASRRAAGDKLASIQAVTAATLKGAEAQRRATLEEKYRGMEADRSGSSGPQRKIDEAEHQQRITEEALKTGMALKNQIETLDQQIAKLKEIKATQGDTLEISISLRNLETERIHLLSQQALQLRGARDGVRAFFIEMQAEGKSAAQSVYEALTSALDKTSDNLAKALTGQKAAWGAMFKDIGEVMVKDQVKAGLQRGLGAVGQALGIDLSGAAGKPTGSASAPFHVIPHGYFGGAGGGVGSGLGGGGGIGSGGGIFSGADSYGGLIMHSMDASAAGDMSSGAAAQRLPVSGGGGLSYSIDARGADLGAANRVARAIELSHSSAVQKGILGMIQRSFRTPSRVMATE